MLPFKTYYEAILKESVKSKSARYKMMFSKFLKEYDSEYHVYEKQIDKIITDCVTNLKKDNIIVFVLKTFRDHMIKLEKEHGDATRAIIQTNNFISSLEHYLSLPIPEINNYNYAEKTRADVIDDFREFESEWKKSRVQWIDITDELKNGTITPIITYEDGHAWFDLSKPYCELEGDAMGHCGNSAAYNDDDTVLSYRLVKKVRGEVLSRPSLTFILDGNRKLGEMKGRANEKPKEKYHDAIVDLLLHKKQDEFFIQGIKGGGYAPENNFNINDLKNEHLKEKLFTNRPEFEPFESKLKKGDITEQYVKTELSNITNIPKYNINVPVAASDLFRPYGNYNYSYIEKWTDWKELLDDIDVPRNLKANMEDAENDYYGDNYFDREVGEIEVMDFLEDIMERNSVAKARILKAVNSWLVEYPDLADEGVEIDPNTAEGVYNLLKINDPDTIQLVRNSINEGERSGSFNTMMQAFKNGIESLEFISDEDGVEFSVDFVDPESWMDSAIYAVFSLKETGKVIDSKTNPFYSYSYNGGDMRTSSYGWDGYDDDYARSVFENQLDI